MIQLERRDVLHRGAPAATCLPRRPRRRGAQASLRDLTSPPRRRRPAARHRQALGAARDPLSCRQAHHRRRVRRDQAPSRTTARKAPGGLGGFPRRSRHSSPTITKRLDGSGYPRGLTAMDMSLETRILAVCDVYDALVSDRVYCATALVAQSARSRCSRTRVDGYDQRAVAALRPRPSRPSRRSAGVLQRPGARDAAEGGRDGRPGASQGDELEGSIERPLTKLSLLAIWSITVSGTAPSVVIAMTVAARPRPGPGGPPRPRRC